MIAFNALFLTKTKPWLLQNPARCWRSYSKRNLLELQERKGFIEDVFPPESAPKLVNHLCQQPRTFYAGFDPTARSLHVGNLVVIMGMLHAQRAGHQVMAVIGGATAKIGDPSGKTAERETMSEVEIDENCRGLRRNLETIFGNHEKHFWDGSALSPIKIVDNRDWYKDVNVVDFLSSTGRHFRMAKMLSRESVKLRMESSAVGIGMSFAELAYQVFQAYDWYHLLEHYDCTVQLGGSDQMGNIASGHEFITRYKTFLQDASRRRRAVNPNFGILLPLITTADGQKVGKTQGAAAWLLAEMTSPFDFYQYFLRLPDPIIEKMLYYFTFLPPTEIRDLLAIHEKDGSKQKPHVKLAESVTTLVHGPEGLDLAKTTTAILYGSQNVGETLAGINKDELKKVFSQAPHVQMLFSPSNTVLDLANKLGCFANERDASKVIEAGGFSINQVKRTNESEVLVPGIHLLPNNLSLVRVGKRNFIIVEWNDS